MKYIALLRGINVGGNNKVEMKKLKGVFESLGFTHVSTYINSGNVIFETQRQDRINLIHEIEKELETRVGLPLRIVLRDEENIRMLCDRIPEAWKNDEEEKTDILFLWDEVDRKESVDELRLNPTVDVVRYFPGAIVWHIERKYYAKSGMNTFIGSHLYKNMTARNINTLRKLNTLLSG